MLTQQSSSVAFDSSVLSYLFFPDKKDPVDKGTGKVIKDARKRTIGVVDAAKAKRGSVFVPAPALAELLVHARSDLRESMLRQLWARKHFRLVDFDEGAAMETAAGIRLWLDLIKAKEPNANTGTKRELKYDHMIIGAAKSAGAVEIYTADQRMARYAEMVGLACRHIKNIPIPSHSQSFELGR